MAPKLYVLLFSAPAVLLCPAAQALKTEDAFDVRACADGQASAAVAVEKPTLRRVWERRLCLPRFANQEDAQLKRRNLMAVTEFLVEILPLFTVLHLISSIFCIVRNGFVCGHVCIYFVVNRLNSKTCLQALICFWPPSVNVQAIHIRANSRHEVDGACALQPMGCAGWKGPSHWFSHSHLLTLL
jgi:hypothetical protein